MKYNAQTMLMLLCVMLALPLLSGCKGILPTGTVTRNDAGIPRICSKDWMQDQTYAGDDGDGKQQVGEDTPETANEAFIKNEGRRAFCKKKG